MLLAGVLDEDFINYKKPCMTVMFPFCTFKCNQECGQAVCHNMPLANSTLISISSKEIVDRYIDNPITESIVMQGLEPFDSFYELKELITEFSSQCKDDIVIYTGYNCNEISGFVKILSEITEGNNTLIIKYGRFIPGQEKHYDDVLGVYLASDNQYAKPITLV